MSAHPPERSFLAHWKRGVLILVTLGMAVAAALLLTGVPISLFFFLVELVLPERLGTAFEDKYAVPGIAVASPAVLPWIVSAFLDQSDAILNRSARAGRITKSKE
jgi:4-amino-4-deoxy-L-arabinose transferase-like glycosyltransferase